MNTFLPYCQYPERVHGELRACAASLDNKRLGKQRVEIKQILNTLDGHTKGWRHHPAVLMWRRYEIVLAYYGRACCQEWVGRGFTDSLEDFFNNRWCRGHDIVPSWWGVSGLQASHRSNLLRKDRQHYRQFGWDESDDLPYLWPVTKLTVEVDDVLDFCS